jgi:hypothetical protein
MSIKEIDDKALWDKFIDNSQYGMLFHKWDFLKIIEKHTGYSLRTFGFYKKDELFAVMPMFYIRSKGVRMAFSPPQGTLVYIPYMGLVMSEKFGGFKQQKKESFLDIAYADIEEELKKYRSDFTSITFEPEMNDVRQFMWNGYDVELRYTYIIDLDRPLEAIWDSLNNSCRQHIKAGESHGFSVKPSTDVDLFIRIMAESLKDQGNTFFKRQSPEYLKDLFSAFPENVRMYFLYLENEVVGATVNCEYKDLSMGWLGDPAVKRGISSNEYFNWEIIKQTKARGFKRFENWGADMKRLNMFKTKFNPELVPYYHVRKKNTVGKISEWGYGVISSQPYLNFIKDLIT